ncbi:uncharacterized protein LOC143445730 isoform X2 [Clavelina lepadiformis]|uniref:uncharacterized protein LOC143445730 isoform X2 n=1 Tax=Clavelina lepadiformis TaxID=159417 RepID=UPI004041D9CE
MIVDTALNCIKQDALRKLSKVWCSGADARRCYSSANLCNEEILKNYKFFVPVQLRPHDYDQRSQVAPFVAACICGTLVSLHLFKCPLGNSLVYTAENTLKRRKVLDNLGPPLGGVGVTKIGTSSVEYQVALFKPKVVHGDMKGLDLGTSGRFIDTLNMDLIKETFEDDAALLMRFVVVIIDPHSKKPVIANPIKQDLEKILI